MSKNIQRVLVLRGGWSAEREVSLVSGQAALAAIQQLGFEGSALDVTRRERAGLAHAIRAMAPDVVFNALHGEWGEDGCVQGLLEVLGIPYTHSGVLASSLAMNKAAAKSMLRVAGLPVPEGRLLYDITQAEGWAYQEPYVIKPNASGSSVDIHIVRDAREPTAILATMQDHFVEGVLMEQYIPGRELTCAVMGDRALGVTEIVTHNRFYDYDAKYAQGGSSHIVPADIPDAIRDRCMEMARKAHQCLGCRGLTRTDFRYSEEKLHNSSGVNDLFILEINTQPGLTPTSLAPEQAAALGICFEELITWMIGEATCRQERVHG